MVEIQPLEPADVIAYLRAVGWPPETDGTLSANGRVLAATISGSVCLWDMPAAAL